MPPNLQGGTWTGRVRTFTTDYKITIFLTVPTALLAQEAKREGRLSQLVYLEQEDEDD
jgi:hypothetical protein